MAEENHARARRDRILKKIQHLRRIRHRPAQGYFFYHDAITLGLEIPRVFAARVLLIGHQHFIAGFHVHAVCDVAVGFGGIAKQGDFVALAPYKLRQRIAKLVPRCISPNRIILGILLVHLLGRRVAVEDGAQHRRRTGAYRAIVQVNFIGRNEKLLAQFGPIGLVVIAVLGRVGKRCRHFL